MKNKNKLFLVLFLLSLLMVTPSITKVNATVGGETVLYDFKYNPADESVYYTKQDSGGRGCPPELAKISLNSEKTTTAFSCSQGETMSGDQVTAEIHKRTKDFKPLTPLDLKLNTIAVDVTFVKTETYGPESNEVLRRHFTASVYQNGNKIKEFSITGCTTEQPFLFQGYAVPGFNKKIMILVSAKGDCFEGGYIYETLYVVGGVDALDKTIANNFFKGPSPLVLHEGNSVVYESDKAPTSPEPNTHSTTSVITEEPTKKSFFQRLLEWFRNLFQVEG